MYRERHAEAGVLSEPAERCVYIGLALWRDMKEASDLE